AWGHSPGAVLGRAARAGEPLLTLVIFDLRGKPGHGRAQRIRASRQDALGLRGPGAVGRCDARIPVVLLLGELGGLPAEVGQVAFERRTLEQVLAALEGLAQLALGVREALERLLSAVRIQILEGLLQLLQPLAELWRQR